MDDILASGTKLKWTEEEVEIGEIEQKYGFPQIVKVTPDISKNYNLPECETVMLVCKRKLIRLIAQTVEEGHYVIGKQVEIPNDFSGFFKISSDYERDETPLQTFRSIQEVADAFPPKIYIQEQLTVTLANNDGSGEFSTVALQKGDELTLVSKSEVQPGQSGVSKPASRFISKVRPRSQILYLIVHCARMNESLSLPMSIQGWFATKPPLLVNLMERRGLISLQQIMEKADLPLTVIVSTNTTRSVKDEFVIRTGMHLKLIGLEEHNIVLAITPFQKIVEFASSGIKFKLPAALSNGLENDKEKHQYQTYVQSAFMNSKLQNSPTNVDDYCLSVRYHVPRNIRPTKPTPLNSNASARSLSISSIHQQGKRLNSNQGISAIQLLSSQGDSNTMSRRGLANRSSANRRSLPPPGVLSMLGNPPLPPRNSSTHATVNLHSSYDQSGMSALPVPPKFRSSHPLPKRPPPTPPLPHEMPLDLPQRPAPVPHQAPMPIIGLAASTTTTSRQQRFLNDVGSSEDEIWEALPVKTEDHKNTGSGPEQKNETATHIQGTTSLVGTEMKPPLQEVGDRSNSPSFLINPSDTLISAAGQQTIEYINMNATTESNVDQNEVAAQTKANGDVSYTSSEAIPVVVVSNGTANQTSPSHSRYLYTGDVGNSLSVNGVTSLDFTVVKSSASEDGSDISMQRVKIPSKQYVLPPEDWMPPENVRDYTVDEVANSLRYIGLSEDVVSSFGSERIDGIMLLELNEEILEQDFSLNKLYRYKIKRFIEGWRPKLSNNE